MKLLEQNRFESYALRNISMDMEVTQERNTAKSLMHPHHLFVVSPGDTIYVRARLQPWRGGLYKDLSFDVPEDQPLEYGAGSTWWRCCTITVPAPAAEYNLTEEILSRLPAILMIFTEN